MTLLRLKWQKTEYNINTQKLEKTITVTRWMSKNELCKEKYNAYRYRGIVETKNVND